MTAVVVIDARTRGAGRGDLCARGSAWGAYVANGELGPRRALDASIEPNSRCVTELQLTG